MEEVKNVLKKINIHTYGRLDKKRWKKYKSIEVQVDEITNQIYLLLVFFPIFRPVAKTKF